MGIDLGRDIGTGRLSWRRLWLIIERLPETSAVFRERNADSWRWNLPEQLLATACDLLAIGNWMQSEDGRKNRNRPKRIERPGVKSDEKRNTYGSTVMDISNVDAWLAGDGLEYRDVENDLVM